MTTSTTTGTTALGRPSLRKRPLAEVLAAKKRPPAPKCGYRGVAYTITQEPTGWWMWKVLPANTLHVYDDTVATGFRASREAAEVAAKMAIDLQFDS